MYFQTMIGNSKNWTVLTTYKNQDCLNNIQLNKTDFVVATVHFPPNAKLTKVRQCQVGGEYSTAITSFYDSKVDSELSVDILDTFNSFRAEIWFLIPAILSVIGGLMITSAILKSFTMRFTKKRIFLNRKCLLKAKMDRRKIIIILIKDHIRETFRILWTGLINKDNSLSDPFSRRDQAWSRAILRVSLCFFMFWTIFFFTSMVQTELISVRHPLMINNYRDILDNKGIMPYFIASATDHLSFMEAPRDSEAGKIWTRVENQAGGYKASLLNGQKFLDALIQTFYQRRVMITSRERDYAVRSLNYKRKSIFEKKMKKKEFHSLRSWTSADPSAKPVLRGFVSNVNFDDRTVRKRLRSAFEHAFEKHIHRVVKLDILTLKKLHYVDNSPLDEKYECMGDTIEKPLPTFNVPSVINFKKLFAYQYALGMTISLGVLLLEATVSKNKKIVHKSRRKSSLILTCKTKGKEGNFMELHTESEVCHTTCAFVKMTILTKPLSSAFH